MSSWSYIVVGLCLALLVFLLWQEWRRPQRSWLYWRCAAVVAAVGGLCCLGLPMGYWRDRVVTGAERVLLSEGYDADSVRAFLRSHPGIGVDTVGVGGEMIGPDREAGADAGVGRWDVFGYGLTREEWMRMKPARVEFFPAALRGVVGVDWQWKLQRGERLVVHCRWAGGLGKLLLMGMGEVLDSVKTEKPGEFSLSAAPAELGRAVYRLLSVEGKDTVAREDVPVEVIGGTPLRVLLLAASPDFENSFLMKWLSGNGHAVAGRTIVSRGKAQESFANREPEGLGRLTPALLAGFDVVVADASALPARETAEGEALRRQVEEKGLGLVIRADSAGMDSMIRVMRGRPGRVLVKDSMGRVAVGGMLEGSGRIVFTSLNTSYSRWLAGDRVGYADHWSKLLKAAARVVDGQEQWSWEPALPRVRDEVSLRLQTAAERPQGMVWTVGEQDTATVFLAQDPELLFMWRGTYWPKRAGWQRLVRPMGDSAWWYVWPRSAWNGVQRLRRVEETRRYALERGGEKQAMDDGSGRERVEIPKGLFWGLFLLGAVFLWVERKISGMSG